MFETTKTLNLVAGDIEEKKTQIKQYFQKTYRLYESLFECLKEDQSFLTKSNTLRHPLVFYYGHTAVFYINKLKVSGFIENNLNKEFESMFAIGVDEMSWDDLDESHYNWPSIQEIKKYRQDVFEFVSDLIDSSDLSLPITESSLHWIIMMGIEHERIHLETSSVLIREHDLKFVKDHPFWGEVCLKDLKAPENTLVDIGSKKIVEGVDKNYPYYFWDNEKGSKETLLESFQASRFLVSNKEFLEFVEDEGYLKDRYWCEEGIAWRNFKKAQMPVFWKLRDGKYFLRLMLKETSMLWSHPVEVNCLEAQAFCRWKSEKTKTTLRLPYETEWYSLREGLKTDQPEWENTPGNVNLEVAKSTVPVDQYKFDNGLYDVIGNVWQWSQSVISGHDGFETHPAYDDFSTPTFDNKHNLIKGGSWISTGNLALKKSRYAFRRHFFQHAGFRYVSNPKYQETLPTLYEKDLSISQILYTDFKTQYTDKLFSLLKKQLPAVKKRALDFGCRAGKTSIQLLEIFEHVDAVERSAQILVGLQNLEKNAKICFEMKLEGQLRECYEYKCEATQRLLEQKRLFATQTDFDNMSEKFHSYDFILVNQSLSRCDKPGETLKDLISRLNPGGVLCVVDEYLNIGGYKDASGESVFGLDQLKIWAKELKLLADPQTLVLEQKISSRHFVNKRLELSLWKK